MKAARATLLVVLAALLFAALGAEAAPSCREIFTYAPSSERILRDLDLQTRGMLLQGRPVEEVRAEMGLLRRWKSARLLKRLDLSNLKSSDDYSDVISDLHLIFVEPRLPALDIFNFLRSGDARFKAWVERETLRVGLRGLVNDPRVVERERYSLLITRAVQNVRQALILHDRKIPADVLMRALENGIDSERPALEKIFGRQSRVDLARALKPYLSLLAYALLGQASQTLETHWLHAREAARGEAFVQSMDRQSAQLDAMIAALKREKGLKSN